MSNANNIVADAISAEVNKRFDQLEKEAEAHQKKMERQLSDFQRALEDQAGVRTRDAEERLTKAVRNGAAVILAILTGVVLAGSYAATREVNNGVIALQKDIISAQSTIQESNKDLEQTNKSLSEAGKSVSDAEGQLTIEKSKLEAARTEANTLLDQIKSTDDRTNRALTSVETAYQKTQQLISDLQAAKSEYARLKAAAPATTTTMPEH